MNTLNCKLLATLAACLIPLAGWSQVNSGSDGQDGTFSPTQSVTIDMTDHPDGIYQYTSVNIPSGVTVTFKPNANNSPVVWLVQTNCVIAGAVSVSGNSNVGGTGGAGGPGGWRGGSSGNPTSEAGQGPGGGTGSTDPNSGAGASSGSYATPGTGGGTTYGNIYLLPLLGGSGGGGTLSFNPYIFSYNAVGGGGGGGAILIAASNSIQVSGAIGAGGGGSQEPGSGGGIRLVTTSLSGGGSISAQGGSGGSIGSGRVRIDAYESTFAGSYLGTLTQGFQPIILPIPGQGIQLAIVSVGGVAVGNSPGGVLVNPDVIIPGQQNNPVSVVVNCSNVPLNSEITVVVHPANGPDVQSVGVNNTGSAASSTATVPLNIPRGGGIIYAKAVTGVAGTASTESSGKAASLALTGWTATGERFKSVEVTAALGGSQHVAYVTESGKRYEAN